MRKEKHVFSGGVFSKGWKLAAKVSESVFGLDLQIGSAPNIKFKATKHGLCPLSHSHVFQGESEVDVIAEQLKFRACLKILMTELRTLATGFEVDGGKLRFQLYNWLEKEIAAMHKICNYKVDFNII